MADQPRWPAGTPVAPGGHGPGGGRFRDWATRVASRLPNLVGSLSDAELDARAIEAVTAGLSLPDSRTAHRPGGRDWTPERAELHEKILTSVYARYGHVPADREALMAGGLPGAGKTTILGSRTDRYVPVDPDIMKTELVAAGAHPDLPDVDLSPMELSTTVLHQESSYLADRLMEMALADGRNILVDATMGSPEAPQARLARLRAGGYQVRGVFVDIPVETSVARTLARYREGMRLWAQGQGFGGRPIPPAFIEQSRVPDATSRNRLVFEHLASLGLFDAGWEIHDNSGPSPRLAASG